MTSVQNHRLPLSGNSTLLGFILSFSLLLLLSACDPTRRTHRDDDLGRTDPVELDPIEGKRDDPPAVDNPIDPVDMEDPILRDPIDSNPGTDNIRRPYRMVYLLPFLANTYASQNRIDSKSEPTLQFIEGARLALEQSVAENSTTDNQYTLEVKLLDSEASEQQVLKLLTTDSVLIQADIIVGPWRPANLEIVSKAALARNQHVYSPFMPHTDFLSENNPRFVQVSPSLKSHIAATVKHLLDHYKPQEVLILARQKPAELERIKIFQLYCQQLSQNGVADSFKTYLIEDDESHYQSMSFSEHINGGVRAVVIPSWTSESFVYSAMRLLKNQRKINQSLSVYGMPQWKSFHTLIPYLEDLNVHLSVFSHADPDDLDVNNFQRRCLEKYGYLPTEETFLGYDLTGYLMKIMTNANQAPLSKRNPMLHEGLSHQFRFVPNELLENSERPGIQNYENTAVQMVEYEGHHFQRAD